MGYSVSCNPLVSVVISLFNKDRYIAFAIESVLRQTYDPVELIIIDDGSTDSSAAIARKYSEAKVISQENQGAFAARNNGAAMASGDFLAFLDADDIWYKEKLEKQMAIFSSLPGLSVVTTLPKKIDQNGKELPYERKVSIPMGKPFSPYKILLETGNPFCLSSALVSRTAFKAVKGFRRIHLSEDYDFWIRLAAENNLFYMLPYELTGYRILQDSKLHGSLEKEYGALLNMLSLHKRRYSVVQNRRRVSKIFYQWADSANWTQDKSMWYAMLRAIRYNPMSLQNYKLLLKIIRKKLMLKIIG